MFPNIRNPRLDPLSARPFIPQPEASEKMNEYLEAGVHDLETIKSMLEDDGFTRAEIDFALEAHEGSKVKGECSSSCTNRSPTNPPESGGMLSTFYQYGLRQYNNLVANYLKPISPVRLSDVKARMQGCMDAGVQNREQLKSMLREDGVCDDEFDAAWKEMEAVRPNTDSSNILPPLHLKVFELMDDQFPHGVNQYNYPQKDQKAALGCTFSAISSIEYIQNNFKQLVSAACQDNPVPFIEMQKAVITQGNATRREFIARHGIGQNGAMVEEIAPLLNRDVEQKNHLIQSIHNDIKPAYNTPSIDESLDILFDKCMDNQQRFALVTVDGQSFALYAIDREYAFLIDTHKSQAQIVNREAIKKNILFDHLNLDKPAFQGTIQEPCWVDFDIYHGIISL